jgi:hypothetical protein
MILKINVRDRTLHIEQIVDENHFTIQEKYEQNNEEKKVPTNKMKNKIPFTILFEVLDSWPKTVRHVRQRLVRNEDPYVDGGSLRRAPVAGVPCFPIYSCALPNHPTSWASRALLG